MYTNRLFLLKVCVGVLLVLFGAFCVYSILPSPRLENLATCFKENIPEDVPDVLCLQDTVKKLLTVYSTREVLNYAIASSSPSDVVRNCHDIGHIVGEETLRRTNSLEDTLARCNNRCLYSCIHGAIGAAVFKEVGESDPREDIAHAKGERLEKLAGKYCAQSSALCHGIGHVLFISHKDYPKVLQVCDAVATSTALQASCYSGAFMESAGTINSLWLDGVTPAIQSEDYAYPCSTVAPRYQNMCFQYLSGFQGALFLKNGVLERSEQLVISRRTCESLAGTTRSDCFFGLGHYEYRLTSTSEHAKGLRTFCDQFEKETDRESCTIGLIGAYAHSYPDSYPEVLAHCENISEQPRKSLCYYVAFQTMPKFLRGQNRETQLCDAKRSPECTVILQTYLATKDELPEYKFGLFTKVVGGHGEDVQ
jgi:hypothetical protein